MARDGGAGQILGEPMAWAVGKQVGGDRRWEEPDLGVGAGKSSP
jgi:hypothetical protein